MSGRNIQERCWTNTLSRENGSKPTITHVSVETGEITSHHREALASAIPKIVHHIQHDCSKELRDPSVYVGATGMAYGFLKLSFFPQLSDQWSTYLRQAKAYLSPELLDYGLKLSKKHNTQCSIMLGSAGLYLTKSILAVREQGATSDEFSDAVANYVSLLDEALQADSDEWLYGKVGYLHGCLLLDNLHSGCIKPIVFDQLVDKIVESGRATALAAGCSNSAPLMYRWMDEQYLGAAHGLTGILYMLIQVPSFINDTSYSVPIIQQTMRFLIRMNKNDNWPAVLGDFDGHLVHFCHGAPGAVYLFCRAYEIWKDSEWRDAALKAGETVWRYGLLKKGGSLCHGIAGNGYSLLALYKMTKDHLWLDRAVFFALQLTNDEFILKCRRPDNPFSLYEGEAGWLCFLADLLYQPMAAAFPYFEIGGLPSLTQLE